MINVYNFNPKIMDELYTLVIEVLQETGTHNPEDLALSADLLVDGFKQGALEQYAASGLLPEVTLLAVIKNIYIGRMDKAAQDKANLSGAIH